MKLHLGCGNVVLPYHVNVDIDGGDGVNLVIEPRALPFAPADADLIYSCAVLEHFGRQQWNAVRKQLFEVLKSGGLANNPGSDLSQCHYHGHRRNK